MALQISALPKPVLPATARRAGAPVQLSVVANLLRGLNKEQRAAVAHGDGPLVVIAGPGTGKTEVVTRRVAWLIASKRARPQEILALTFTDAAAEEMQTRVDILVPYGHSNADVHTFHAFGDRLLRENAFELGLPGDVRLISRAEAIVLLREHVFELGLRRYVPLGDPTRFLGALVDLFMRAKDEDIAAERLAEFASSAQDPQVRDTQGELASAFKRYSELMSSNGLIDHGDQVLLAVRLLRESRAVRDAMQQRYRYLLVDEFQDMNPAQVELVMLLTGRTRNVAIVGDPDQAIYRFRGASGDNIGRFAARHPDLKRVSLRTNYRSTRPIVEAASRLIGHVSGREASAAQKARRRSRLAQPVRSTWYSSPEEEADDVATHIAEAMERGERPSDFAVLARSNGEIDALARSIRARGIPVRTQLPADFFAKACVRPLLAFLRVVADPHNTIELYALATASPYGLGDGIMTDHLSQARRRHRSLWEALLDQGESPDARGTRLARLVGDVRAALVMAHERPSGEMLFHHVRRTGLLARLVEDSAAEHARAVARFFEIVRSRASLLTLDRVPILVPHLDALIEANDDLADAGPLDVDAVAVLTVHRAKGLEFSKVFMTGLTDGRFPSRGRPAALDLPWADLRKDPQDAGDGLDEERRLFYVAMTRARDALWLTHHVMGPRGRGRRRPSPFVAEALDSPSVGVSIGLDDVAQIEAHAQSRSSAVAAPVAARPPTEFSFSELETYIDCPERYRLRHVVGIPSPVHHALTYGSAVHKAVASFHVSRARGAPLSEEALLKAFEAAWSPEGFLSREHEEARYVAGQDALRKFRNKELAQATNVVAVERPFAFTLDGIRIRGRVDRLDRTPDGAVIVDYKTSDVRDQAKADAKARDSLQLQVYALAQEAETSALPHAMKLDFVESGIVGTTRPDPERLGKARKKIRAAVAGIQAADFTPSPNSFACGYCPYRQLCPASAA
ncbi:MAG: ATP-dependent DNA helicase [Candidatus Limnocylindrales bacterium]